MARSFSLLLSAALSLGLLLLPAMRGRDLTPAGHGLLTPLLLSICAGFVHGLGFVPRKAILRSVLRPAWLWTAMIGLGVAWACWA